MQNYLIHFIPVSFPLLTIYTHTCMFVRQNEISFTSTSHCKMLYALYNSSLVTRVWPDDGLIENKYKGRNMSSTWFPLHNNNCCVLTCIILTLICDTYDCTHNGDEPPKDCKIPRSSSPRPWFFSKHLCTLIKTSVTEFSFMPISEWSQEIPVHTY
jgi:hypothetical protein